MFLIYYHVCVSKCLHALMKTDKIYIRVTDDEKQQLEEEAMRRGITQSELIRSLIARLPVPSPKVD
jgi:Ribbon-helix-helix protein, copG family